jgi:hypothetical protein
LCAGCSLINSVLDHDQIIKVYVFRPALQASLSSEMHPICPRITNWRHTHDGPRSMVSPCCENGLLSLLKLFSGDVVYVNVFGQHMVFVNSMDVAVDLFEKRSSIYSDRCNFSMMNDLCVVCGLPSKPQFNAWYRMGCDWVLSFMHYGEGWRRHRKAFHQHFRPTASATYRHIQVKQAR